MFDYENDYLFLNGDVNDFDNLIDGLKSVGLENVWSGESYDSLSYELTHDINSLIQQNINLRKYIKSLKLMEEYTRLCEEINRLRASLPSGDDEEAEAARAMIEAQIAALTNQLNSLINDILQIFSEIQEINDESNDIVSYSDDTNFDYAIDLNALVARFYKDGKFVEGEFTTTYNLYELYNQVDENGNEIVGSGQDYVNRELDSVLAKYSGREAAVNSILVAMQLAANKDKKLHYSSKGNSRTSIPYNTNDQLSDGMDCCSFVSWALNKGTADPFHFEDVGQLDIKGEPISYAESLPGDIYVKNSKTLRGRHVGMIIENNVEMGTVVIAEAKSPEMGVVISEVPYSVLEDDGFYARSYEDYYTGEKSNA